MNINIGLPPAFFCNLRVGIRTAWEWNADQHLPQDTHGNSDIKVSLVPQADTCPQ